MATVVTIIITLFQEDNIFGTNASLLRMRGLLEGGFSRITTL